MEHLLGESDNNRAVEIRVGESIRIVLPENATTGYRWEVDRCDRPVIGLIAEEPNYTSVRPGSGGRVHFVFEGRGAGSGDISLKEWRSWEGDASVIARYHLRVKVLP